MIAEKLVNIGSGVTTGITGQEWIERLRGRVYLREAARQYFLENFEPTTGREFDLKILPMVDVPKEEREIYKIMRDVSPRLLSIQLENLLYLIDINGPDVVSAAKESSAWCLILVANDQSSYMYAYQDYDIVRIDLRPTSPGDTFEIGRGIVLETSQF